jgi:Fur family transcriptional regulator, zinc uptake regulator
MRMGLTRNETEVLELLRAADLPLTAYQLISRMQQDGRIVAPPTVYRALKGLEDAHHVRRIETLRAWAAVQTDAPGVMAICDDCGTVRSVPAPNLIESLSQSLVAQGFTEQRQTIEVHGRCGDCSSGARA